MLITLIICQSWISMLKKNMLKCLIIKIKEFFFTNPKKPYYKFYINFNYYKSDHKEANELERVDESEIN